MPDIDGKNSTDYAKIYDIDLTYVSRCHTIKKDSGETCHSYCCTNFFPLTENLEFQQKNRQELYLMPGEHEYLKSSGKLDPEFAKYYKKRRIQVSAEIAFQVESIKCGYKGECRGEWRPVICRLYPHFPDIDAEGHLQGLKKLNQFDEFLEIMQKPQVCSIMDMLTPEAKAQFDALVSELCKDPVNIFYLKAARIFRDNIIQNVKANHGTLLQLEPGEFFAELEKLFYLKRAFETEKMVREIQGLYSQMQARWGERFVLPK